MNRYVTDPPAGTVAVKIAAALVPAAAGLTAPFSPLTTYRWKASLTYGDAFCVPNKCSRFDSFSVNASSAPPSTTNHISSYRGGSIAMQHGPFFDRPGLNLPFFHVQLFRNQTVCNSQIGASSGPRLWIVTRPRISEGVVLA